MTERVTGIAGRATSRLQKPHAAARSRCSTEGVYSVDFETKCGFVRFEEAETGCTVLIKISQVQAILGQTGATTRIVMSGGVSVYVRGDIESCCRLFEKTLV